MPNGFKYNVSTESLSLKRGNFYIATGDVGKGTTNDSGFYNGITPSSDGYTIYLNKASGGPSIYVAANDSELISLTNRIAGSNYTTVNQCLTYYVGQSDKMVLNKEYQATITNGLVLSLDSSFVTSYPRNGTTWYDNSNSGPNNITLTNGPTFNSSGFLTFDGSDDYANFFAPNLGTTTTVEMLCKIGSGYGGKMFFGWLYYDVWCGGDNLGYNTAGGDVYGISSSSVSSLGLVGGWKHYVFEMRSDVPYTNNKIFINGVSQTLSQQLGGENTGARNFNSGNGRIAGWLADTNYPMPMDCVSFRVYNRALSQSEILQNYYQGNIVTTNLLVNLDAGNIVSYPGSGSIWYDLSGNNNHFTLYNGVGYSLDNGGCLTFDGSNDYVRSTNTLNLTSYDYIAVEVFYKCDSTSGAMLFEHTSDWNSNIGGFGLATNVDGNNQLTNCNHTNHNTQVARNYLVSNNSNWNNNLNLYSKISDSTGRLTYVNGGLVSFTSVGGYPTGTATSTNGSFPNAVFYIGSRGGSSSFFNGRISSIKIYGFKINGSQVQQNFNTYRSRFGI
jgi:hypothetical protein